MNDYHSIALNFVISCNIHAVKTQKVCECQDTNFNKNALIFFSSNYINWILIATFAQHICENCISTFFHNNRLCHLLCILTSSIWNFRANFLNDEFWNFLKINFFNDAIFSTMRLFQRCVFWSFRANFLDDVNFDELNHTSMRKLQKRTNRNSMIYWFQIWRRIDL